eukprot:scaffold586_cov192-Alexandrium_tamarense.AAC.1
MTNGKETLSEGGCCSCCGSSVSASVTVIPLAIFTWLSNDHKSELAGTLPHPPNPLHQLTTVACLHSITTLFIDIVVAIIHTQMLTKVTPNRLMCSPVA